MPLVMARTRVIRLRIVTKGVEGTREGTMMAMRWRLLLLNLATVVSLVLLAATIWLWHTTRSRPVHLEMPAYVANGSTTRGLDILSGEVRYFSKDVHYFKPADRSPKNLFRRSAGAEPPVAINV